MAIQGIGTDVGRTLVEEGFELPPECTDVDVLMPADGVLQLRYTVNIKKEDLPRLSRVFQRLGEIVALD